MSGMGKPKKNKKAEIKARRKTRKANEHISRLRKYEKFLRAKLKVLEEQKETFQKLSEEEAIDQISSSDEGQNNQSVSECDKDI